ncbi:MAG: hypothetical protein WBZ36_20470, partial [Candidatus Nitrosopolaris sp.]
MSCTKIFTVPTHRRMQKTKCTPTVFTIRIFRFDEPVLVLLLSYNLYDIFVFVRFYLAIFIPTPLY